MIEGQEGVSWPDWVAIASACEEHGIPALFRSDHYMPLGEGAPQADVLDAWSSISALAAVTSTVRLGTLVSPATFRHPAVLAKMALSADTISGGRVELGLGAGWHAGEHEHFGFEYGTLGSRMDEFERQIAAVRRFLSEDSSLPRKTGPLPLIVGGSAKPRTVRLAAQYADEYNTVFATTHECRERRAAVDAAWAEAGRAGQARFSLMTGCIIGRTGEDVERRRQTILGSDAPHPAWVTGTLTEAATHLSELADAGVDRVMLQLLLHRDLEQIELIGELS
jgi:alkanesulfonate monooxygenase SsuD/methylene tetrahydromethanopterin reductase-like flavin-dependent oxidoreductase (luciferase family)